MARKTPSLSATLILCSFCLLLGWFAGLRSSNKQSIEDSAPSPNLRSTIEPELETPVFQPATAAPSIGLLEDEIDFTQSVYDLMLGSETIEDPAKKQLYLRKLLEHWIASDPYYPAEKRDQFLAGIVPLGHLKNTGYETVFSYFASGLSDSAIRNEWKAHFKLHPARSEIFTQFLYRDLIQEDPITLLDQSTQWNPWEKERYQTNILQGWARKDPSAAYAWYDSNKSQFSEATRSTVFDAWANSDFDGLSAHIDSILDPETRISALDSLAKEMARRGTDSALDWANSLKSAEDQDLAHDTIYRETPRGIGAILKHDHGFPSVVEPLVPNGLEPGDLIISAQNGEEHTEFYGKEMIDAVDTLLGTPGTDVTVQVMRLDPTTGEYRQVDITITRQQLWMEGDREEQP